MQDLRELPKLRDGWSYLYVEHCRIDQEDKAIAIQDLTGKVPVPCASLALLMLGPGTSITHAAIRTLADNGCLVVWVGEHGVRFYAQGVGESRSAASILRQAAFWADPEKRMVVVRRMYEMRFNEVLSNDLTLKQIRGREGVRVRQAYAQASKETGIPWNGRNYDRGAWGDADPVNRALSAANSCLYGVCHAAIVSLGYATGIGFIHTGKQLSFVYDVADLYKADITIPVAFRAAASEGSRLESTVRHMCRDAFSNEKVLSRIVEDLERLFEDHGESDGDLDWDGARPGSLWDPEEGVVHGGHNYAAAQREDD